MLTKNQILKYLSQLADELKAQGLKGEILLTGGAAMCLVHEARDMTKDIDALYEPKTVINQIAAKIAEQEGLPSDWLKATSNNPSFTRFCRLKMPKCRHFQPAKSVQLRVFRGCLNDSIKGFVGVNAPIEKFMTFGNLVIQTVSTEYLLAMKIMSARYGEKDSDDILFLMNKLGIKTAERATEILLSFFPSAQILPKTQYIIEEIVDKI